ncbi:MAG: 4-alpha-glucanotransferase [bacterium]|nr:4-alpha-glucanotransferase [bacterium]
MTTQKSAPRRSGILLHPTSLPGPYGIGDLGPCARSFIDFLAEAGQQLWQVMPLGPTGFGDSPYQCFSAFAGNHYLISLDELEAQGLLTRAELAQCPPFPRERVDYGPVITFHLAMLRKAYQRFSADATPAQRAELEAFARAHRSWLDDYALFMACKDAHDGRLWSEWSTGKNHITQPPFQVSTDDLNFHRFLQYEFFRQWDALRRYAHTHNIRIIGDMPIFVAYDSADVWAHPQLFYLDEAGRMTVVAGVPPDYFSATGQLWGNPLYRWDACRQEKFRWWIERFRHALTMVDIVRIDHFRGFESCWAVPAGNPTAEIGEWLKTPGDELFATLRTTLGPVPLIAEDLGVITPEVEALRDKYGFPGMKILQFGFGGDAQNEFLPHNYPRHCVVYTGSHDNDTSLGWYRSADEKTRDHVRRYFMCDGSDISWVMIRAALASVAELAIIPLQDVLSLDSTARMNFPGRPEGNWQWRYVPEQLTSSVASRLRELTELYGRISTSTSEPQPTPSSSNPSLTHVP